MLALQLPFDSTSSSTSKAFDDYPFEAERTQDEAEVSAKIEKFLGWLRNKVTSYLGDKYRQTQSLTTLGLRARTKQEALPIPDYASLSYDQAFWDAAQRQFASEASPLAQSLISKGVMQADKLLPAVNFELANETVFALASSYQNEWWDALSESTRNQLREAIQAHIRTGASHPTLIKNLTPLFGKQRADVIATTEVTRLYALGNLMGYHSAGITKVEWRTARDERVCPICVPLFGQQFETSLVCGVKEVDLAAFKANFGQGCGFRMQGDIPDVFQHPPAHVRCRCWLSPVVDGKPVLVPTAAPELSPRQAFEQKLSIGELTGDISRLGNGVSKTFKGQLTDGTRVAMKPLQGLPKEKLRAGIPIGQDLERELAAYRLNEELGRIVDMPITAINGSPIKVAATSSSERGAGAMLKDRTLVQELIEGSPLSDVDVYLNRANSNEIAFFDSLIGNLDRHTRNLMVRPDGSFVAIDHGLAFPRAFTRAEADYLHGNFDFLDAANGAKLTASQRKVLDGLLTRKDELAPTFEELLGRDAWRGTLKRAKFMLNEDRLMTAVDFYEERYYSRWQKLRV